MNVSVQEMAVSQKRPNPASKTGIRAASVDQSKHANKQLSILISLTSNGHFASEMINLHKVRDKRKIRSLQLQVTYG